MRVLLDRWWRGRDPIVGIDIREDGIVFADIDCRAGGRWLTFEKTADRSTTCSVLGDAQAFISTLRDFLIGGAYRIERCAVGIPESLTYVSRVSLPKELLRRPERVRYEAALERVYLRARDVRGRIYPLCDGEASVLVVAAKVSEVAPLEDAVRSLGIELACLTPRVVALHHLVTLSSSSVTGGLTVYFDPSVSSSHFHLFKGGRHYGPISDWHELLRELDKDVDSETRTTTVRSLIMRRVPEKEALLRARYVSTQSMQLSDLSLWGGRVFAPNQVAAGALSLWEARRG